MIDWSAASRPKRGKDSIWYCLYDRSGGSRKLENPATRHLAFHDIETILTESVRQRKVTLVGFDFPFGYPSGFSSAAGLAGAKPWLAAWNFLEAEIKDDESNKNNRFEVAESLNSIILKKIFPFWGHPNGRTFHQLKSNKGRPHVAEFRMTELIARGAQSVWKLYGNGAVGSQALVGIPWLARLRNSSQLNAYSAVWPFETGLELPKNVGEQCFILYAEIFPSLRKVDVKKSETRDEAQVKGFVQYLKIKDERGSLSASFLGPRKSSSSSRKKIVAEEGWILGVKIMIKGQ